MATNNYEISINQLTTILNGIKEIQNQEESYLTDYFYLSGIYGLTREINGTERNGIGLTFKASELDFGNNFFTDSGFTQSKILNLIHDEVKKYFKPKTFEINTYKSVARITIALYYY